VASKHYNMKRVGNVNPGLLINSPRKHLVPATYPTRDCKRGLGLSNKATVGHANMNQFNQFCGSLGANMVIWIAAALGHEGRGYNAGVGHQDLGGAAAAEPQNDPHKAVEALVTQIPSRLSSRRTSGHVQSGTTSWIRHSMAIQ
jgi:hypothetical protein